MSTTDPQMFMVELRSGSTLAPARIAHMKVVEAWCQTDGHSKLRRKMLHDSLEYYAYTGKFTRTVIEKIKADTDVVEEVNGGQPVSNADVGVVTDNGTSWWLTDIAPVPSKFLPSDVKASDVWYSPKTQGEGVDVYVVDEGFGKNLHSDNVSQEPIGTQIIDGEANEKGQDFYAREVEKLWPGKQDGEKESDIDESIPKEDQHGYYVARLAAGLLSSPAPKSRLCWISYLQEEINNNISNIGALEALSEVWECIERKGAFRTSVINCSWGTQLQRPERDVLARLCQKIAEKVVFVAACGNHGLPMEKIQPVPAWLPETISVGCTVRTSEQEEPEVADFSNYGDRVDIYAPGTHFRMTDYQGYPCPGKLEGTSFCKYTCNPTGHLYLRKADGEDQTAAPLVTASVACLLSGAKAAGNGLKPSEVKEILLSRSRNFTFQKTGEKPRRAKKLILLPFPDNS
ncbi:MAG: hypothetical protein Q9227_008497 [Pyrenula ochraceoflavens]